MPTGHDDIVATLQHIQGKIHSKEGKAKLKFLTDFFDQKEFKNAVGVHHKVLDVKTRNPPVKSVCSNCQEVREESLNTLCSVKGPYTTELLGILNKPHLKVRFYNTYTFVQLTVT